MTVADGIFEHQILKLDERLQKMEEAKQYELELAGNSTQKQQEIEERYARKTAEIKRKQAVADKTNALFKIAINTAVAAMAQASIPGAGFGLAAAIIALGAIQAAIVAAKPIPKFFKGTDYSPEGLAWIGEKGRELVRTPSGETMLSPESATLTYLKKGTQIVSNPETEKLIAGAKGYDSIEVMTLAGVINDGNEKIYKAIKNKKEITIYAEKRKIVQREGRYFKTFFDSKVS